MPRLPSPPRTGPRRTSLAAYVHAVDVALLCLAKLTAGSEKVTDEQLRVASRKKSTIPALGKLDASEAMSLRVAVQTLTDNRPSPEEIEAFGAPEASKRMAAALDYLSNTGSAYNGTNSQLMQLIGDALDVISPSATLAQEDAEQLAQDFHTMAECWADDNGDAVTYTDDDEIED